MIKPIKMTDIPKVRKGRHGVEDEIKAFVLSSQTAGEIEVPQGRNAKSVYITYYKAANRIGAPAKVCLVGERVFIVKENADA